MKQYLIDELRPDDYKKIKAHLDDHFSANGMDGVYWIPLDPAFLKTLQVAHRQCQPFFYAVVLEPGSVACEFLVRTKNRVSCDCIQYVNQAQQKRIIEWMDHMIEGLDIRV